MDEPIVLTDQIVEGSWLAPLGSSEQQVILTRRFTPAHFTSVNPFDRRAFIMEMSTTSIAFTIEP